ncbi:hypothetical protein HYC85_027807 [Camellia sinensis]|uniref:Uncharacterized protein n=1 Tax=Camellia sinensis TaxID=4442 RepID=A0A7J7FXB6_CAMSI|nr:hypothetical protein HYC85_027807 [Camellia sinensis]
MVFLDQYLQSFGQGHVQGRKGSLALGLESGGLVVASRRTRKRFGRHGPWKGRGNSGDHAHLWSS